MHLCQRYDVPKTCSTSYYFLWISSYILHIFGMRFGFCDHVFKDASKKYYKNNNIIIEKNSFSDPTDK